MAAGGQAGQGGQSRLEGASAQADARAATANSDARKVVFTAGIIDVLGALLNHGREIRCHDGMELRQTIEVLAGEIGERNVFKPEALSRARDYLAGELERAGYKPRLQGYKVGAHLVENIVAEAPGSGPDAPPLILGAHYDTAPDTPGADDNGSGVAALLELARALAAARLKTPVRFVFFTNEEPPFFQTRDMGSWRYAQELKANGERVAGMLSLEMLGFYAAERGTQSYPPGVGWFYPDKGDFIALVGDLYSTGWVRRVREALKPSGFPVESACLPRWLPGIDFSDHWSFWEAGFPGAMLTDTAFYRNPHYHMSSDVPERLDYERLGRLTGALLEMAGKLAG